MRAHFQEVLDILPEHPDNDTTAPTKHPFPIAFRNTAAAWAGLTSLFVICYFKLSYFGSTLPGRVYWLAYAGCLAYSASICFLHAFLATRLGPRRAGQFLKIVAALTLAALLASVWYSLQPKSNGGI